MGTQRLIYDGADLIAEYNTSGTVLRRYVHGPNGAMDDPLVWYEGSAVDGTTRRSVFSDTRGSIIEVTTWNGDHIATNSYDEYGIPDSSSGADIATKGRFRYTGQIWLPELGMYYYKPRMYSPRLAVLCRPIPSAMAACFKDMGQKLYFPEG